jgi:hypothetical protein
MAGRGELTGWTPQLRNRAGCVPLTGDPVYRRRAAGRRQAPEPVSATGGTATEHVPVLIPQVVGGLAGVCPAPVVETTVVETTVVETTMAETTVAGSTVAGAIAAGPTAEGAPAVR